MAEQNPSLHIDTDWKKQAQEEKRKLAEEQKRKEDVAKTESAASAKPQSGDATARAGAKSAGERGAAREMPTASFATLVQSIVTQALFYLGDLAVRGNEPVINLDMAKHQIDLLGILDEKTASNLSPEEKKMLDAALYETRMRYVAVASQYLGP